MTWGLDTSFYGENEGTRISQCNPTFLSRFVTIIGILPANSQKLAENFFKCSISRTSLCIWNFFLFHVELLALSNNPKEI